MAFLFRACLGLFLVTGMALGATVTQPLTAQEIVSMERLFKRVRVRPSLVDECKIFRILIDGQSCDPADTFSWTVTKLSAGDTSDVDWLVPSEISEIKAVMSRLQMSSRCDTQVLQVDEVICNGRAAEWTATFRPEMP